MANAKLAKFRLRDTRHRLRGGVKGPMADTLTSISQQRGWALVLVNPAYTSQIDAHTGLLQVTRRGDQFYGLDGVVLDTGTPTPPAILARIYGDEITLYTPHGKAQRLLRERIGTTKGMAPPELEPAGPRTRCWRPRANDQGPLKVLGTDNISVQRVRLPPPVPSTVQHFLATPNPPTRPCTDMSRAGLSTC